MSYRHAASVFALVVAALAPSQGLAEQVLVPVRVALPTSAAPANGPANAPANTPAGDYSAEWTRVLAARRAVHLQRLSEYAERGVFPRNSDGVAYQNIFRDERAVLCAVANLMALSGATALVDQTANERNGVRLGEVTDGPLLEWMRTSGFTQEELAAIQEPDMPMFGQRDPDVDAAERARAQAHFRAVHAMLRARTERSLALAVRRLGALAQQPPPAV